MPRDDARRAHEALRILDDALARLDGQLTEQELIARALRLIYATAADGPQDEAEIAGRIVELVMQVAYVAAQTVIRCRSAEEELRALGVFVGWPIDDLLGDLRLRTEFDGSTPEGRGGS
jgi:hypothetical protein